jgi:protease-4
MRADELIDRRRLRRKLSFWRVAAFLLAAIMILSSIYWTVGDQFAVGTTSHIARVRVEGTILEDEDLIGRLDRIAKSRAVKGVILTVDSPGGTTAGGEAIYEAVRRLAEAKPVVAQVGTLAASAGYMVASAADHIVARQTSIVGSIGVLVQYPDLTGLMEKIGVRLEAIKSSPLKAEPNPFTPTTPEERAMVRAMILDTYEWFISLVAERRSLPREEVARLADGSVFTGRQALERKLVDALGGEKEAVAWLVEQGVDADLKVIEWKPASLTGADLLLNAALQRLGLGAGNSGLLREIGADRIFLDGLLSVWQPEDIR